MANLLGRYEIFEQLGTGSMGTVYRAHDTVLDRDVALKTIRTSGEVEPEIRERFYREARACARLQHPSIVSVYDLGEVSEVAFIAMELLRGEDLRKVIERRKSLTLGVKIKCMVDVCEGLYHAHQHGVIHRDIKPSNLFLTDENQIKITDFGIARLPSSKLTFAGNILGTPNYMAPEQILGKPSDARADLFSAATVFFELLVWIHPFQAKVIPNRIVKGEPDSLFDYDSTVPVLLDKILARALTKDIDARYTSALDLANDLRAVLDALRQNASPTMSHVQLPSDRALPRSERKIEGDATQIRPTPTGEDPAEWRLSEVLRLIPEFEEAVERKDESAARDILDQLRGIAAADDRFVEAVESSQSIFDKVWGHKATNLPPTIISGPPQPRRVPANATTSPGEWLAEHFSRLSLVPQRRMILVSTILVGTLIFLTALVITYLFKRPVPMEARIGSALVQSSPAYVRKNASISAPVINEVKRGEPVLLLELPKNSGGEWIRVQYVAAAGQAREPGYIRIADLQDWSDWTIDDPPSAAQFARQNSPGESATEPALRSYISKLRVLSSRLIGTAGDELQQEAARLDKVLEARSEIPPEAGTGMAAPEPPPAVPTPRVEESIETLLGKAERALRTGDYAAAKRFLRNVLRRDPANTRAQELMRQANRLEEIDAPQ
jgi:serine/threonine-protein kinase